MKIQEQIHYINNYMLSDDDFIEIVLEAGKSEDFENASYDTIDECVDYINLCYDVFGEMISSR